MYDVIIVGAGPAGLMAAIAASESHKVLVIEKNASAGKKLLITGGGRCNVSNLKSARDFLDVVHYNKKYLYSALNKFSPEDIYQYFTSNDVALKIEQEDQLFPISNKSSDILQALLKNTKKVDFLYNEAVIDIGNTDIKKVITDKGKYKAKNIIIATGGVSFPKTGSTGDHIYFAKKIGQPVTKLFPAETSIILKEKNNLMGTSFENVEVSYMKKKTEGNLMFTHKGLSGSAIMKMSECIYLNSEKKINIDLLPDYSEEQLYDLLSNFDQNKQLSSFFNTLFTKRFTEYIIDHLRINKNIKSLHLQEKKLIVDYIKNMNFLVDKVESIENAYVTGGGIDLNYIDTTTMESKINKGIYFVGESLDIHGPIGGYNITLALSTGHLAGSSIR